MLVRYKCNVCGTLYSNMNFAAFCCPDITVIFGEVSSDTVAEQRTVADAPAQNAASCTCLYPLKLVCVVDCDCPIHGTRHSESAGRG
jgi:hypothetical protein